MSAEKPPSDALLQIMLNVVQELWVVKDRQAILEQVLEDAGVNAAELVDNYQPSAELTERLQQQRREFLATCLAPAKDSN